ncbi:MAG: diacylglycerol kinase family protein [bacterium]
MKTLVIVAATAGTPVREALRRSFEVSGCAFEIVETQAGDPVSEIVRDRLREGFGCVAAVGGDGTVSAVAHALVGGEVPLGIVPAGTGNLVARELGIPLAADAAVALITGPSRSRRIDAMRIGGRTYLLNAGVGINAEVIDETSRLGKSLFGRSAYFGTAVWKVLQAKTHRLEITVDGETRTYHATDVAISNCGILAKALNPNGPDVRADDGAIDVCILCMKSPLEYPWYYFLRQIAPKRVNKIIHELVAKHSVTVRSDAPLAVQADGDIIGATPVTVEVLPAALSVRVPASP